MDFFAFLTNLFENRKSKPFFYVLIFVALIYSTFQTMMLSQRLDLRYDTIDTKLEGINKVIEARLLPIESDMKEIKEDIKKIYQSNK